MVFILIYNCRGLQEAKKFSRNAGQFKCVKKNIWELKRKNNYH